MNGSPSMWAVTPEERTKHDQKFDNLSPSMGYVSGEQARKFFLQSGLPASVLAEIWALADLNKDGKMDRLEFSIAMKLIKLKLQGTALPLALPIIMKQPPVPAPNLNNHNPPYGIGSVPNLPLMPGTNLSILTPMSMATPGLSTLTPMTGLTPLIPTATGLSPLVASTPSRPLIPNVVNATLPNGTIGLLQPTPVGALVTGLPQSAPAYPSPLAHSSVGLNKSPSLLDIGSSSSTSSSTPGMPHSGPSDWAVPHASRLKYRQQFNSLDKQMTGYLTGQQVRAAMATTMLTQTQLATIWNLADVDKDGKLKAEEFILAMHLVDVAKIGQPLPLTLSTELVPPTHKSKVNGSSSANYAALMDDFDVDPPQKSKPNITFEDRFKANLMRGNAELEKRRLALQEAERREQERRAQKVREEQERKEREAREAEERRRKEEERRLERQRELERQKEEERQREIERKEAAQRELERQRKEEWERRRRGELQIKKEQEQDDIIRLKAKKRSLEMELEAVGNKHRQISDRLRDIQNKKRVQKTEIDLIKQQKDARQQDINNLQKQLEEFQRKLSQLTPEKKRLTEKLKIMGLNNRNVMTLSTLKVGLTEKEGTCKKLREQMEALEKETAAKLAEMDQYNKDMQELRENQRTQQAALEKLRRIKEDKRRELMRRKEQEEERRRQEEERRRLEEERKRKEEEEAQRRIKMEKERQWQEKLRRDEEERQRKLQEEREARQREEEEKERQALIMAAKMQAERELRAKEEAERKRREEEERKKREEEERQRQAERRRQEEERRKLEEERRQLEEERRKLEEERRKEEKRRKEEEERKRLDEERRREREEEERRRQRAAEAAIRDAEERRRREEAERKRREEAERKRREEAERRRREEEEEQQQRKREEEMRRRREEEERKRREEEERRKKEEERKRLQQQEEERRRREEERKLAEEERKRKKEEEEKRITEEEKKRKEQQPGGGGKIDIQEKLTALLRGLEERKGGQPRTTQHRKSAALTSFKALYPFTARNHEELSFNADDLIEVDETTEREEGWLYGSKQGKMGWFPESYVERVAPAASASSAAVSKVPLQSQLSNVLEAAKAAGTKSAFTPTHTPNLVASETQGQQVKGHLSAQALCSWTAKTDNHLNFNKDDVIQVLEQQENWWLGELNGQQGWFPKTYVKLLGDEESSDMKSSADALESSDSQQLEEFVALYTYESPEPVDLTFRMGDVILVTKREGDWWNGTIGDRTGLFPGNYVKPKETDTSSSSGKKKPEIAQVMRAYASTGPHQLNLENAQLIVILGKNVSGWWLGELQARGKKRQKGWFPASHVKILGSSSGKSTPASQPVCQVKALYDYTAANQDEMSFTKGQLINVLDKNNTDWWKGEVGGVTGLFPTNYVTVITADCDLSQQWCADPNSLESLSPLEKKRQGYIHELIETEDRYVEDLKIVLEVFHKPMMESGRLSESEMTKIFVNWKEVMACNTKLLKLLNARQKSAGENKPVQMIGDILAEELSHMQPYILFCSVQIEGAEVLQIRTDNEPDFKLFLKKIATDYRCKGMPLSSFLLKPMQRITRYPLHIKKILECTAEGHADQAPLKEALERAEELCQQVNEGVREKENSDRFQWIQSHVQCDGVPERLKFDSLTSCLGPRRLLYSGRMYKVKSNKELCAFLFNDFLLLTYSNKPFASSGPDKLFSSRSNIQYKMYKAPVLLNEVLVKLPDPSSDEPVFHISHIDRVYVLRTDNINERTAWVQKIKAASEEFIETEKKKRDKAYQASRSLNGSGIGRLLVTILEATELKTGKYNGKSNPYCEVTMGAQTFTSRVLNDTVNPKWNFSCQFHIKDIYQDVLSITILERNQFNPDDFLGRTEVPVATIKKEFENKGSVNRKLLLHEVPTGEVWVRLDLKLFNSK